MEKVAANLQSEDSILSVARTESKRPTIRHAMTLHLTDAIAAFRAGRLAEAERAVRAELARNPRAAAAWNLLVRSRVRLATRKRRSS